MMKEMAVKLGTDCALVCLDDNSIGEPGSSTSTGVRAHNKSLIPKGAKLSALDHDFHIHGAVPSVLLDVKLSYLSVKMTAFTMVFFMSL